LKSKGSSCDDVGDPDLNDGAANCNVTRAEAAAAMVDWLATDPTASGDEDFLIIGDLNAYRNEDPIDNLELGSDDTAGTADDYVDLLDAALGADAYSFVFDGQVGYLDYALANQALNAQVTGVTSWHINADEINILDYNDDIQDSSEASFERESGALPTYEANAFRASDHDPIIVGLNLANVQPQTGLVYVSTTNAATLDGIAVRDEDIMVYDLATESWAVHFDGSDVGLGGNPDRDVKAFTLLDNDKILLVLSGQTWIHHVGWVDDSDILLFVPSSLGSNTSGYFQMAFDGSDVHLSANSEAIDAIDYLDDGRILISTVGNARVGLGTQRDEDILAFSPTKLGYRTRGTWELYFDGSDVGLSNSGQEDVNAIDVADDQLYFSTVGAFDFGATSGGPADVATCELAATGSTTVCSNDAIFAATADLGLTGEKVDGVHVDLSE
ncbi:MAG: hypothetical protein AAGD96_30610, partial [Chloroflexota bacterium]